MSGLTRFDCITTSYFTNCDDRLQHWLSYIYMYFLCGRFLLFVINLSLDYIGDAMDSRRWRMVTMALEKPNNSWRVIFWQEGSSEEYQECKRFTEKKYQRENENLFKHGDKTEDDPFACKVRYDYI